jgi:AraC-like DNA-binding protein
MTFAADTFASFLELLVETLDDQDVSADTLAARVHLSRSHFDRIISAVAGEPPASLRRRIMLERAAYQLLATDHDVLRIAISAGYASHEAFTRAFARAYGRAPSLWRRDPGGLQLEVARQVHFYPPGGLRVASTQKVNSMDLLTRMLDHHVFVIGQLVDGAARLTDDQLNEPIPLGLEGVDDRPTTRTLLARLVGQMAMWDASMHNRPYDFESERGETLPQIKAKLAEIGPSFLGQMREILRDNRVDDTFVDAVCDPPQVFTYGGMIAHILTYAAYRRTLVTSALYEFGVRDIQDDPMHFVEPSAR